MRSRTNTEGLVLVPRVFFYENTYRRRVFHSKFVNFSKFNEKNMEFVQILEIQHFGFTKVLIVISSKINKLQ